VPSPEGEIGEGMRGHVDTVWVRGGSEGPMCGTERGRGESS